MGSEIQKRVLRALQRSPGRAPVVQDELQVELTGGGDVPGKPNALVKAAVEAGVRRGSAGRGRRSAPAASGDSGFSTSASRPAGAACVAASS
jgi:hypothetical protein